MVFGVAGGLHNMDWETGSHVSISGKTETVKK